jgi:hypothetical protein
MLRLQKDGTREEGYYWLCVVQEISGKGNCN